MILKHSIAVCCVVMASYCVPNSASADIIDFTEISLSDVSSPDGQDFLYSIGAGSTVGNLNVRLVTGQVSDLLTGADPDPNGFYAFQQSSDLTPATFRFTFDSLVHFQIAENETLTNRETNIFTAATGSWSVLSSSNTLIENSGSKITLQGTNNDPPYGDYVIAGSGNSFDFEIINTPGFGTYGSAVSINVTNMTAVPEPSSVLMFAIGSLIVLYRNSNLVWVGKTQWIQITGIAMKFVQPNPALKA